LAFLKE
jgi:aarF domain-containing kinase